jgi:hypothetical protein
MPYPFTLPTTSHTNFSQYLSSSTHPSLPQAATNSRVVLRDSLKHHKRLPPSSQPANLPSLLTALNAYIPYLFALDAGLKGGSVANEHIDVVLLNELESEWRCTLTAAPLGRDPPRAKMRSLEPEICFTLEVYAYTQSLLARERLRPLYRNDHVPVDKDERAQAIAAAMKHLLTANSVHVYLLKRSNSGCQPTPQLPLVADISPPVLGALASLALAEATLITVLKDDPYPFAVAEERNKNSKEWMFRPPELPQGRTNLFGRLCMAASEHAAQAAAALRNAKGVDEDLITYMDDLRRTARAKAARFQAIGTEGQGKVGEGISWLRGAKKELGFAGDEAGKMKGITKLKKEWKEKREDRKVTKGDADWGADAGRFEEGRVLDMLEKKWVKMNDTVRAIALYHGPTLTMTADEYANRTTV